MDVTLLAQERRSITKYSYSRYLQPCYRVVAKYANGTYGRVRITKDVIFDMNINFRSELDSDLPTEAEFNSIPSLELVADEDNADALRRQLILAPAIQEEPVPDSPSRESRSLLRLGLWTKVPNRDSRDVVLLEGRYLSKKSHDAFRRIANK